MFNHIWAMQWTTIILLSYSFDHVQSLGLNLQDSLSLINNNLHPHQITRCQALPNGDVQTPMTQDIEYCDSIINDAYCSSGIGQKTVDISLSCGQSIEEVRQSFTQCARSESGAFCESLNFLNTLTRRYLEGNCSRAITSNICSAQCRTHLEDFRSKLGCCINAYLNDSNNRLSVNYHLWNLCGVPLPAMDCQNHGLTFRVPANAQNCTFNELINQEFTILCRSKVTQQYLNGMLTDTRCSQINLNDAKHLINICSINPRGEFCSLQIRSYEVGLDRDYVSTLHSNCNSEISNISHSTLDCRPTCRNELMKIKDTLGCCVNYHNRSTGYPYDISSLAYGLWASCGVETPDFCESPLSLNGAASTAYAVKLALAWVALAIVLSIFQIKLVS